MKTSYLVILDWMVECLHLKGNALVLYAIIYGFTQNVKQQKFTGSLQYLADWTQSTKAGVLKSLKSLLDAGLIEKEEITIKGVKYCAYYATELNSMQLSITGYATQLNGVCNSVERGMQLSIPNNIENNKAENPKKNIVSSLGENAEPGNDDVDRIPYSKIMEMYNSICKSLPSIRGLSSDRKKHISARFNNGFTIDDFRTVFENAEASDFLAGRSGKQWSASFDWLICDKYFPKVLEGEYNKERSSSTYDDSTPKKKEPQTWHGHILQ